MAVQTNYNLTPRTLDPTKANAPDGFWLISQGVGPLVGHPLGFTTGSAVYPDNLDETGTVIANVDALDNIQADSLVRSAGAWVSPNVDATVEIFRTTDGYNPVGGSFHSYVVNADQWVWISTGVPTIGYTKLLAKTRPEVQAEDGMHLLVAGVINSDKTATVYFDGDTADTSSSDFAWTGAAQNSASTKTDIVAPVPPPATPTSSKGGPSMRINWDSLEGRYFDTGLDRGVLYPKGLAPLGPIVVTNYVTDPTPTQYRATAIGAGRWAGNGGAVAYSIATGAVPDGTTGPFARKTWTTSTVGGIVGDTGFATIPNGGTLPVKAGDTIRVGAWLRSSRNISAGYGSIYYNNGRGTSVNFDKTYLANTWTWMEVAHIVPTGATSVSDVPLDPMPSGDWLVGNTIDIWGVVVTKNQKIPKSFNGSTLDTGVHTYEWAGAANNSLSYIREVQTLAVPWMGLQSVDEEGGESASAYYIDGRPFLFLPRPKEFKATLKAVTFPDAFSEIMGIAEVADGMFLDSQNGNSFDLTYRTLVGNGVSGTEAGYKIHLVYNATVAPQALTYESLSNSINPTSFSWEIQAVPVQVEGFRPTAHIIIDTRHMQQSKIDAVEAMLYGSDEEVANMPTPQQIFDLLSFGDTIVVTDNGDGTFDVIGSYENVYMVGDGVFRVDNIDGQDNGDGTFTISTTAG